MISALILTLMVYLCEAQSQKTTIWTESFTSGVVSTTCQCQKWMDFWRFWIGDPSQVDSITLSGSLTSTTYKCSGSAAQFVAFALATPPFETTQVTCESGIWYTGNGVVTGGLAAVGVTTPPTACSSNPAIRPCWTDICWGGIGSVTCSGAPSQSLTVTVVSNIPTVTVPPASVKWADSFAYNVPATSAQCNNWKQFWQNTVPRSGSLSVTLMSSINGGLNVTCSGPGVNLLATALFTATTNGQYHCSGGTVWYFNDLYPGYSNTSALSGGNTPGSCSASWALKPCWDQPLTANWGGFGNVTCAAATQTFTATVAIGTNTMTNVCWQKANVASTAGTFTISCNANNNVNNDNIMLQCNTNYSASGYGTSLVGSYYCTSGIWCPTVPNCVVASTTTTTTTTTTSSTLCTPTTTTSTTSSTTSSSTRTSSTSTSTSQFPTTTTPVTSSTSPYLSNAQSLKTTIWTESFSYQVVSTACQCQKWKDFWQFWIGDPSQVVSITLGGSGNTTTYKCSGSAAQFIAFALNPPYETTQVTCESGIWKTAVAAVGVVASPAACSSNPAIRPCWTDFCWGGFGGFNCIAPSQSFTVTVVSNIPTVTVPPASVTWTDSFAYNIPATTAQCNNWKQFWQNTVPRSGSLSVTLMSSINGGLNATCSGPGVNLLATALFTATSSGQNHCSGGTVWYFNDIYPGYPSTSALSVGNTPGDCSASWALKPCWDQPLTANWGGFGNVTCSAATQTFTATVAIGISKVGTNYSENYAFAIEGKNTFTNTCWQQVNVAVTTGTFTVSCNTITLQCNTNYTASGYGTSSVGAYYCTSGVWCPTVPTCNVAGTTSPTTTTTITTASTTPCITTTTSSTTSSTKSSTTATSTTKSTTSSSTSPSTSSSTTSSSTVRPTTTVSSTMTTSTSSSTSKSPATTAPTTSSTTTYLTSTSTISTTATLSSTSDISGSVTSTTYDSSSLSSFGSGSINTSPPGSTQQPLKVQTTSVGHSGMMWLLAAPVVAAVVAIGGVCAFLVFGTKMKRHNGNVTTQTSADI